MGKKRHTPARGTRWMRWIARVLASVAGALWLFVFLISLVAEVISGGGPPPLNEGMVLTELVIILATGAAIAWRWEGIGGIILLEGAIAFGTFSYVTARSNKVWIMLFTSVPFVVAGILSLACSIARRGSRPATGQGSIRWRSSAR